MSFWDGSISWAFIIIECLKLSCTSLINISVYSSKNIVEHIEILTSVWIVCFTAKDTQYCMKKLGVTVITIVLRMFTDAFTYFDHLLPLQQAHKRHDGSLQHSFLRDFMFWDLCSCFHFIPNKTKSLLILSPCFWLSELNLSN